MSSIDRTLHGAAALVSIASCIAAQADPATSGRAASSAILSLREVFRREKEIPATIYEQTKEALDLALADAHLTSDDRDKIHYAINEGCPSPDRIIALGRNPQAIASEMAQALTKTDATEVLEDTFINITSQVLGQALANPDTANELSAAYQKAMLDFKHHAEVHFDAQSKANTELNAKLDELLAQNKGLMGVLQTLANGDQINPEFILTHDELVLLAQRFKAPDTSSKSAIIAHLTYQANQITEMQKELLTLQGGSPELNNVLSAIEASLEAGDIDGAQSLLSNIRSLQKKQKILELLAEDAVVAELEARTALLQGDVKKAFQILKDTADGFKRQDYEVSAAYKIRYWQWLYHFGLHRKGTGLLLAATIVGAAVEELKGKQDSKLYILALRQSANTLQEIGHREYDILSVKSAIFQLEEAEKVCRASGDDFRLAAVQHDLGDCLERYAKFLPKNKREDCFRKSIDIHDQALQVRTKLAFPMEYAATLQNRAGTVRSLAKYLEPEDARKELVRAAAQLKEIRLMPEVAGDIRNTSFNLEIAAKIERELALCKATSISEIHWSFARDYVARALSNYNLQGWSHDASETAKLQRDILDCR